MFIFIPARYASTRLPGKPLQMLAGKPMLQWVIEAASQVADAKVVVVTDNYQIAEFTQKFAHIECIMTPSECASGTDRIYAAIQTMAIKPKYIVNLQGDAPLATPNILEHILTELKSGLYKVVTPGVRLTWEQFDHLLVSKKSSPNSGTLCIKNVHDFALWFSKQMLPQVRDIDVLRRTAQYSPYIQHLGIYGYTLETLEQFVQLPPSFYEKLECLEQLRFLENNIPIKLTLMEYEHLWRGVDTIDDLNLVASILSKQ